MHFFIPILMGRLKQRIHIKTLKRVSYGFKSFENMKIKIFLMNRLVEIK